MCQTRGKIQGPVSKGQCLVSISLLASICLLCKALVHAYFKACKALFTSISEEKEARASTPHYAQLSGHGVQRGLKGPSSVHSKRRKLGSSTLFAYLYHTDLPSKSCCEVLASQGSGKLGSSPASFPASKELPKTAPFPRRKNVFDGFCTPAMQEEGLAQRK